MSEFSSGDICNSLLVCEAQEEAKIFFQATLIDNPATVPERKVKK